MRRFCVGDDAEGTERGDHFDHQREGKRQTKTNISHAEEAAREPCPKLTDWIRCGGATAISE
jgi:hypothetical protein